MNQGQETIQTMDVKLDRHDLRRVVMLAFGSAFVACLLALLLIQNRQA